ncbi:MAG TPA: carbohydrate-binding protein [Candidatus Binatia bacterium]|nr:carbohydrate-binding protein [Candidatus Binatia bacterium]
MRKRIIPAVQQDSSIPGEDWLDLERVAQVEITSEDPVHPIESALLPGPGLGWRAAGSGEQSIRILFSDPPRLRRIWLHFVEPTTARTQEFALRWSADGGKSFREIVRQQWNFSPQGATCETEDHRVDLSGVTVLELSIIPDISGGHARASLAQLRLA